MTSWYSSSRPPQTSPVRISRTEAAPLYPDEQKPQGAACATMQPLRSGRHALPWQANPDESAFRLPSVLQDVDQQRRHSRCTCLWIRALMNSERTPLPDCSQIRIGSTRFFQAALMVDLAVRCDPMKRSHRLSLQLVERHRPCSRIQRWPQALRLFFHRSSRR